MECVWGDLEWSDTDHSSDTDMVKKKKKERKLSHCLRNHKVHNLILH